MENPYLPKRKILTVDEKIELLKTGKVPMAVDNSVKEPNVLVRAANFGISGDVFRDTYINWPNKMTHSAPGPTVTGYDINGNKPFSGINFASQDYMSLCYHPGSVQATVDALKKYGTHSGGSPLFFGKHPYYIETQNSLIKAFSRIISSPAVSIFTTGWMAGFGVVSSLSTKSDHIIMDELCHNCLILGARNNGAKIHKIEHLDNEAYMRKVVELRKQYPQSGIICVTEGLFSMDSDCPDLVGMQKCTKENNAILVIDCAHDMFGTGKTHGLGNPGELLKDFSNVVLLGSGSKSLSNNFGWCVSSQTSMPDFMNLFAGSLTFSNAISPAICASVTYNIDLLMSKEGDARRKRVYDNAVYLRAKLKEIGYELLGDPSPIVLVLIGSELLSRAIANMMYVEGIVCNSVESPACGLGEARLRLQLQADHTKEHLDTFIQKLIEIKPKVEHYLANDPLVLTVMDQLGKNMQSQTQKL
jgi:glycine C-acetyltransferase